MAEPNSNPDPGGAQAQQSGHGGSREEQRRDDRCITIKIQMPKWIFCSGVVWSVVVGVIVAVTAVLLMLTAPPTPNPENWFLEVEDRSGKEGVQVFRAFDRNQDGFLSIIEFEPLLKYLQNVTGLTSAAPGEEFLEHKFIDGEEVFIVNAHFEPLQLETMTKEDILNLNFLKAFRLYLRFIKHSFLPLITLGPHTALFGLKNWQEPYRNQSIFGTEEMKAFLPYNDNIMLGMPYPVVQDKPPGMFEEARVHSNNRFYPQAPKGSEQVLYRLLGMMHPRPFVHMRFPPRGTYACVRAFNTDYYHIIFRMHAEFQLNEPPTDPFWFTPAQFVGNLVISKNGSHIEYFHMHVPAARRLNVDMEWIVGSFENANMEVDIGFMPRMEWTVGLTSSKPTLPSEDRSAQETSARQVTRPEDILWSSSVSINDALSSLEKAFFPFKQVTYHNLTEAYQMSKEQNKPMHGIFLWGALDDQSC